MRLGLLFFWLALTASTPAAGQGLSYEELAPGVLAGLQPRENWVNDANTVILSTAAGLVVIDAPADAAAVRQTIEHIDGLAAGTVRFLVNTHWHSDHTQGNQLYRERYGERLTILGHDSLRRDVPERAGAYIDEQRSRLREIIPRAEEQLALGLSLGGEALDADQQAAQRAGISEAKNQLAALEGVELLPPDVTYGDKLTLHLGGREIRLLHFAAHTDGDTVVYLPADRLLVTGDLLDVMPFAGHGHIASWIETLDELAALDVAKIVPGHGPVFAGTAQLELLRAYFSAIVDGVGAAVERNETVEQAQAAIDLSRFRQALAGDDAVLQRNFDAFAPETIARAFAEAHAATDGN